MVSDLEGRKAAAQAQAQEEQKVCISARESFELVRCLLRVSIYHVSFLRGLFPDNMFSAATMSNLGNVTVQMLGGEGVKLNSDAQLLKDWVEKGVVESIRDRYLKKLYFGIAADAECTSILEEFVFTFAYGAGETTMQLDAGAGGGARASINNLGGAAPKGKTISIKHVKNQIFRLMRTLVELCGTLEEVPEERHIFMRLTYHDNVPDDYEPPLFAAANEEQANGTFPAQPFSMKAGGLSTEHHRVSVRVKSLLDAVSPDDGAHDDGEEHAPHAAAGAAAAAGGKAGGGGGGGGGGDFKGDEGDEGGAAVDWGAAGEEGARQAPGPGIRREEALPPAARAARGAGGAGLGPSQEVDGPAGTTGTMEEGGELDGSPVVDRLGPDHPHSAADGFLGADADMQDAAPEDSEERSPGPEQRATADPDGEVLQLTLAPPPLDAAMESLDIGARAARPSATAAAPLFAGGCSQVSSQGAGAAERVRAHVLQRVARAGEVDVTDVATKFCTVSTQVLRGVMQALVEENVLQQVSPDQYARAGAGDSDDAPRGARRGRGADAGASAEEMPPPRTAAATPASLRGGKRSAAAGGGGGAAFDPESPGAGGASGYGGGGGGGGGGGQHVFDSSQASRRGEALKRRKTSITVAPISQGAIPGGACGVPGDSAATTTPNRSGNRARAGRLGGMRRR
ncbi:MAG: HORMA domain-containing protein [Monoraphidium minutum]|nr:MAG: HORMA domain-containing protein [Monoraphidium minutum]